MDIYKAVYKENDNGGVFALSVVEDPAMQEHFITLSEQKEYEIKLASEEKRLLLGASLVPDRPILRNYKGNNFQMVFDADTIEKLAHDFIFKGNQRNSTLEHDENLLDGVGVVESWVVEDPKNDKSNVYGFEYPKGTWVNLYKVNNEDIWQKAKNKEIKGFSVEAMLGLEKIELSNTNLLINTEMSTDKQTVAEAISKGFESLLTKLGLSTNEVEVNTEAEEVEAVETDVAKVEVQAEEVNEEVVEPSLTMESVNEQIETVVAELSKKFDTIKGEMESKLSEKDKEIEALKVELSKQPETEGVTVGKDEVVRVLPKKNTPNFIETTRSRAAKNIAEAMGF